MLRFWVRISDLEYRDVNYIIYRFVHKMNIYILYVYDQKKGYVICFCVWKCNF